MICVHSTTVEKVNLIVYNELVEVAEEAKLMLIYFYMNIEAK